MKSDRVLRIDLEAPAFWLLALYVALAPLQRGLFFEADLLPNLLVLAGIFALQVLDRLNRRTPWLPVAGLAEAGLALMALAYAAAFFPAADRRAAIVGTLEVLAAGLVFAGAADLASNRRRRVALLRAVWLGGVTAAAFGFASAAGLVAFPGAYDGGRLASLLQYPNALAGLMIVASMIGIGLWSVDRTGFWPLLYAAGTYLCQLALLGTGSRGGWLTYPLTLCLLILLLPAAARGWALYAQVLCLGLALLTGTRALPALAAGLVRLPLLAIMSGVVMTVAAQLVASALPRLLRRWDPAPLTLQALRYGAIAYAAAVAVFYLAYVARVPAGMATVVPAPVLARAETIALGADTSVARSLYARDALRLIGERPLLGAGAGGWDALYHRVQSSLYWSSEVHSHPLQVAVEAGLIGLAGFALAVAGVAGAAFAARREGPEAEPAPVMAVAAAGAAGLLLHACIDFDLSLPGLAAVFWALAGTVRAAGAEVARPVAPRALSPRRAVAWATVGLLAACAVAVPAWRLAEARDLGARAAEAFRSGKLGEARALYERALALDPWQGSYALDLAQVEIARQLAGFDPGGFSRAARYLDHALRVQPYRLPLRGEAVKLYTIMGDTDQAIRVAGEFVVLAPLDVRGYGLYATLLVRGAFERFEAGDVLEARDLLDRVFRLEQTWNAKLARLAREGGRTAWVPVSDRHFTLALGQAHYLAGHVERAGRLLSRVARGETAAEVLPWLAAVRYLEGRPDEASRLLATVPGDQRAARMLVGRILAVHGFALSEVR